MNNPVNMAQFIAPKSDQLNSDDLIGGPRTITITGVKANEDSAEQPISINFEGDDRKPFKPCKSMRRVMVAVWGPDASQYVGRSMTLYRDPKVQFGGMAVGGIRISHMSHITEPKTMALTTTRAKRAPYKVEPLKAAPDPAEKWATAYIGAVEVAADRVALEQFANDKAVKLAELEAKRPDLHRRCIEALDARREEFAPEGRADEDHGDQFTDDAEMPAGF